MAPGRSEHSGADGRGAELHVVTGSDIAEVASGRDAVHEFLVQHGCAAEQAADLKLVASELLSNAVQHGTSEEISVVVRAFADRWELEVSDAGGLDELRIVDEVPPTSPAGRGLFIVRSVCDRLELVGDGVGRSVRCTVLEPAPEPGKR